MNPDLSELYRLLENLIRFGTIAEVDYDAARVRVKLGPTLTTTWRPWATQRAGDARTWWAPSVGEQVLFLSPGGVLEGGVATLSIFSDQFPAPANSGSLHRAVFPDGARIDYDHAAHTLDAILPDGSRATVKASAVVSDAPQTTCTGNLTVEKDLIVVGHSSLNGGMYTKPGTGGGDAMRVEGSGTVTGDFTARGVSLPTHHHGGVKHGDESSDGPQ